MARGSELDVAVRASIVSMRFGAGMEPMLIAAKLNIDPGTVRTTCFRLKKAAGSEDLPELLKHCRTKSRSGRPSMKNVAAASAEVTDASSGTLPATTSEEAGQPKAQPLADTSPDPFAEHFETTAGPEQDDLTTAKTTNTQAESQRFEDRNPQSHTVTASDTALDPQLAANPPLGPEI